MVTILDLPSEITIHIFKFYLETENQSTFFSNVRNVCLQWKQICTDRALWTKYDGTLNYSRMMKLCRSGCLDNAKEFIISKTKNLGSDDVKLLFSNLRNVEVISFENVRKFSSNIVFSYIGSNCTKLKSIEFGNEKMKTPLFYSVLGPFLTSRGQGLSTLKLSNCALKNAQLIIHCIADCCPNLEHLELRNISCTFVKFSTQYVQSHCTKLKVLHLDYNINIIQNKHPQGFPELETFIYIGNTDNLRSTICDKTFKCIVFNSPNLKFLNLTNCQISSEALCGIPAHSMEYLYVAKSKIVNEVLYHNSHLSNAFQKWGHSLKQVDVSHSLDKKINNNILCLVTSTAVSSLEILNLSFTQVSASVVQKILEICGQLEVLNLEGCRGLERGLKKTYTGKTELNELYKALRKFNRVIL